jgi:hypothetical protein
MSYFRDRDRRPEEPSPRKKLEALARAYRVQGAGTLDALIDGLNPTECRNRGRCVPTDKIVEDAVGVYLKAFDALRRGSEAQRTSVRGCTLELLVLMTEQVVRLAQRSEQRAKEQAALADTIEKAMAQLRSQYARALTTREQARRLLGGMARDDGAFQEEVRGAATAAAGGGSASAAMLALAALGRRVLTDPDPKIIVRARLLGLDEAYVTSLETLGGDLRTREAELQRLTGHDDTVDDALAVEAGITLHLMMMVIEAFESAHEIEPSVAVLRPVHTQRLVRRLSKLPPPVALVVTRGR